jgi:hypothetical protein
MAHNSQPSNFDLTRANMPTAKKDKGKVEADKDSEETVVQDNTDLVGDRLLNVYPDRNLGETKFPHSE